MQGLHFALCSSPLRVQLESRERGEPHGAVVRTAMSSAIKVSLWLSEQQPRQIRRSRKLGRMVDRGSIIVGLKAGKGRSAPMLSAQEL
jgi:hypothetical protein